MLKIFNLDNYDIFEHTGNQFYKTRDKRPPMLESVIWCITPHQQYFSHTSYKTVDNTLKQIILLISSFEKNYLQYYGRNAQAPG